MRKQFGGVRFGKNYVPTFALVASEENYVIVAIITDISSHGSKPSLRAIRDQTHRNMITVEKRPPRGGLSEARLLIRRLII